MIDAAPEVALIGSPTPRIGPPTPAVSDVDAFTGQAKVLGITLDPWQVTSARYLEARNADGHHLYREVADLVGRQQGKTTLLLPLIVKRLRAGRKIMHTAQNRELPREMFGQVAAAIEAHYGDMLATRRGRPILPRFGAGQEEIELANGGRYRIVAPTKGGARGGANDDVIIDEVRELDDWQFIAAARPTMAASPDPQTIYLSNAGDDSSVVLNALRERRDKDPRLAYLEWSADPDLSMDDRRGWVQANPAIGHRPGMLEYLEDEYRTNTLDGTLAIFETEHLCRWVASMRERLVPTEQWAALEVPTLPAMRLPVVGIALDPSRTRASMAVAWQLPDGKIAVRLVFHVTGTPINTDRLGKDMAAKARELGARRAGFDPLTDTALANHIRFRKDALNGGKAANATARFVEGVEGGTLLWADSPEIGDDLAWTSRKPHDESGTFIAVRAQDDRPITASLAVIRAVWLAATPAPAPRVVRPGSVAGF